MRRFSATCGHHLVRPIAARVGVRIGATGSALFSSHRRAATGVDSAAGAPLVETGRVGDWTCTCGFRNFAFRRECFQCRGANPQTSSARSTAPAREPLPATLLDEGRGLASDLEWGRDEPPRRRNGPDGARSFRQGDWECQCGTHNFARRSECMTCMKPRSSADHGAVPKRGLQLMPGDWLCSSCMGHNFRSREKCFECGAAKGPDAVEAAVSHDHTGPTGHHRSAPGNWVCSECHTRNSSDASQCGVCGSAMAEHISAAVDGPATLGTPVRRHGDWGCPKCGFLNFGSRVKCKACQCELSADAAQSGQPPTGDADAGSSAAGWVCECGYKNYADRTGCRECGREPSHVKQA